MIPCTHLGPTPASSRTSQLCRCGPSQSTASTRGEAAGERWRVSGLVGKYEHVHTQRQLAMPRFWLCGLA